MIGNEYGKKSAKISDIIKSNIFQLYFPKCDEKKWWRCRRADLSSVLDPLACWLSNDVPLRGSLDIYLTTTFAVRNLGNI